MDMNPIGKPPARLVAFGVGFVREFASALLLATLLGLFAGGVFTLPAFAETFTAKGAERNLRHFVLSKDSGSWTISEWNESPGRLPKREKTERIGSDDRAAKAHWHRLQHQLRSSLILAGDARPFPAAITEVDDEVLWEASEAWSMQWERRYAAWMEAEVDSEFMVRHQLRTDCADVAVALRWIFARIHGLPMGNRLAGSGTLFTHRSMKEEWRTLRTHADWSKDARFRAALDYVLDTTYTHSIFRDSFPVRIDRSAFQPGVFFLYLFDSTGHTQVLTHLEPESSANYPVVLLGSDVPRAVRRLAINGLWWSRDANRESMGLRQFLWLVRNPNGSWILNSPLQMPHYSEEQYSPEFLRGYPDWHSAVLARIAPRMSREAAIKNLVEELAHRLIDRARIVKEGYDICSRAPCEEGTSDYENWSTPARDHAMRERYNLLWSLVSDEVYFPEAWLEEVLSPFLRNQSVQLPTCGTVSLSRAAVQMLVRSPFASDDPRDPPDYRWAFFFRNDCPRLTLK